MPIDDFAAHADFQADIHEAADDSRALPGQTMPQCSFTADVDVGPAITIACFVAPFVNAKGADGRISFDFTRAINFMRYVISVIGYAAHWSP